MKRRLFNFVSALSLLMVVAVAAVWVRSYVARDVFTHSQRWRDPSPATWIAARAFYADRGQVGMAKQTTRHPVADTATANGPPPFWLWQSGWTWEREPSRWSARTPQSWANRLGFGGGRPAIIASFGRSSSFYYYGFVPCWFLLLLSSILPTAWLWRWRRRRVLRDGKLCRVCGYDLRATPERCPECGVLVPSPCTHGEG